MNNETLNWKQAAIAWGEGKDLEFKTPLSDWEPFQSWNATFYSGDKYRIKPQADEKPKVAGIDFFFPKSEAVVPPVTEEKGKRFVLHSALSVRDENYIQDTSKMKCYYHDWMDICDLLNSLHDENVVLKKRNIILEECGKKFSKELSQVNDENEALKKEIEFVRRMKSDIPALHDLKQELAQVKEERDEYRVMFEELRESNDKQATPSETTLNTSKEFCPTCNGTGKLWCAMCGTWGNHQSGTCPSVPRASDEKKDYPVKEAIIARLERVEHLLENLGYRL